MTSQLRLIVKMAIAVTLSLPASAQYSYWSDVNAVGSTGFSMGVSELWSVYLDEAVVDSTLSSSTGYRTGSHSSMSHAEVDLFLNAGGNGCDSFSVHSFHYIISEGWMYNPGNTSDSANVCGSGGGGGSLGAIGDYERFDGESGPVFTIPIGGGTPTAYSWSWAVPSWVSSPQNSPNVTFSSPQAQSTGANTHWYSNDGSQCGSLKKAPYDISASVNFADGQQQTGSGTYKVSIDGFRGITRPDDVAIVGLPTVIVVPASPTSYYMVINAAGLSRTLPVPTYDYVTTGSQFWPKIFEHEEAHVSHFTSGPFEDYQTVGGLWPRIGYYSNPYLGGVYSYVDTQKNIYYVIQRYTAQEGPILADRIRWSEQAAYAYSDNYAPHYHFEGACHPQ